ncbi:MAG: phosphatidate cytidylyltransferase [Emcibacteraceae bacterium]|nr:phosphatidate cytidylyltransferase [Emcibacteraceae bacterium]
MSIAKEIGVMAQDPKKKSGLLLRVISALIMLPAAVWIILSGGMLLFILINLLMIIILYEWNGICEAKPVTGVFVVQTICAVLILIQQYFASPYIIHMIIGSVIAISAASYLFKSKLSWAVLGFFYALIPSISVLLIIENADALVVLWMMILIWSMDTGAYFAGKNIGGPKMASKISPNKTWSGLIGGTILAMVLGYVFVIYSGVTNIPFSHDALILLILSGFLAILSQIGDLAESAVKRKFSVKNSGAIIPGHGGIMDRVDGLLFVAPTIALISYLV